MGSIAQGPTVDSNLLVPANLGLASLAGRFEPDHPVLNGMPDGQAIYCWPDLSPTRIPLIRGFGSPTMKRTTNGINGKPAVAFASSFFNSQLDPAWQPFWYACVVKITDAFAGYSGLLSGSTGSPYLRINQTNGRPNLDKQTSANVGTATSGLTNNQASVVLVTFDSNGDYAFYIDGTAVGSGNSPQTYQAGNNLVVGGMSGQFLTGLLGDILIGVGAIPTAAERAFITARLKSRYGIA